MSNNRCRRHERILSCGADGHARLRRLHQRQGQVGVRGGRHFSEPNPGGRTEPLRPGRGAFRECVGRIRGRERGERVVHTRRPSSQPASRAAAALRPFASARFVLCLPVCPRKQR